jgi:phage replication initiation protein
MTSKIDRVQSLKQLLGMEHCQWQTLKGAHGYIDREYFDGVSIHSNGRPDMGVWLEMSGKGCRAYESYGNGDWSLLFQTALEYDYHITRIDAAIDEHDGILPIKKIADDVLSGNYVSRFKWYDVEQSSQGITVYLGSPTSDIRVRIYDKAAETGRQAEGHWVRCEIQMRNDNATAFAREYLTGNDSVFLGVLKNYIRFVTPSSKDSNNRRWNMRSYWSKFLGGVEALRLWSNPGAEYNLHNLEHFVHNQAGNSIRTYIEVFGSDKLLALLAQRNIDNLPLRYQNLIKRVFSAETQGG